MHPNPRDIFLLGGLDLNVYLVVLDRSLRATDDYKKGRQLFEDKKKCTPDKFLATPMFIVTTGGRSVWCIAAGYTDDKSVGRPARTVAEAEGANYIALVILLVTLLPFAVIIILDLATIIINTQHNKPPRKTKSYQKLRV